METPECTAPQPDFGLSSEQVRARIAAGQTNAEPPHITKSALQILRDNICTFFNALNFCIALALILVGSFENLLFLGVVFSNLLIGTVQQLRAKRKVEKLSVLHAAKARVLREGREAEIPIAELVLDDIVLLSLGDQVPADAELLSGALEANEALLTGESDPLSKAPGDALLSGSFVVSGGGKARLTKVGAASYANTLALEARTYQKLRSELMHALRRIVRFTGAAVLPLGLLLFFRSYPNDGLTDAVVQTAAAMIGMIPAGLMLLTSVSLAISVVALAREQTLAQNLYCTEQLSRIDILCLDKTGTLTTGALKLEDLSFADPEAEAEVRTLLNKLLAALPDDNPTAEALHAAFGGETAEARSLLPFSSARKYSAAAFEGLGVLYLGAPEALLPALPAAMQARLLEEAKAGRRVLLFAQDRTAADAKAPPQSPAPLALLFLADTLRPEAAKTLRFFRDEGVAIKLLSGDHPETVAGIARRLSLPGAERFLDARGMSDEALIAAAEETTIFGRVSPAQKRVLVRALKAQGHTVGMTGDGVNDVLALKEADCSIAMAAGSAAARQIASLVLLDNRFASLPRAVMEGRRVINNITRTASLFLTKTMFSFLLTISAVLLGMAYPFEPIQLSLISAMTIGLPSFLLALEPNRARIEGGFLETVLMRALPGALLVFLYAILAASIGPALGLSEDAIHTLCVYLTGTAGICVLLKVCRPLNPLRFALTVSMAAALFLGAIFLRPLLNIGLPSGRGLLLLLSMMALCYPALLALSALSAQLHRAWKARKRQNPSTPKPSPSAAGDGAENPAAEAHSMHLIIGLGNPGIAYRQSRHNAGFLAIDALSEQLGAPAPRRAHKGLISEVFFEGEKLLLVKPETYMNLSGECAEELMAYYKLPAERLLVLYDDVDLPPGELRIRRSGSAGTHNGMRSIIARLGGEENFPRIRIGVGKQEPGRDLAAHVLGKPPEAEREALEKAYAQAADAALLIIKGQLQEAQAKYNKKKRPKPPEPESDPAQAAGAHPRTPGEPPESQT